MSGSFKEELTDMLDVTLRQKEITFTFVPRKLYISQLT